MLSKHRINALRDPVVKSANVFRNTIQYWYSFDDNERNVQRGPVIAALIKESSAAFAVFPLSAARYLGARGGHWRVAHRRMWFNRIEKRKKAQRSKYNLLHCLPAFVHAMESNVYCRAIKKAKKIFL